MYRIGVISDTHGLLREEVRAELKGCDAILHGGDIHNESTLKELRSIGMVYVVRGNADGTWAKELPTLLETTLFGVKIRMIHNRKKLPEQTGSVDLVVYGHSHKYMDETEDGVRYLNPGSCGPKRFRLPVTMAVVEVEEQRVQNIRKIEFGQGRAEGMDKMPASEQDWRKLVETVMRDVDKGRSVEKIARTCHVDEKLAEQICRMYLTHPGVDVDGILNRINQAQ